MAHNVSPILTHLCFLVLHVPAVFHATTTKSNGHANCLINFICPISLKHEQKQMYNFHCSDLSNQQFNRV